MKALVTGGNGFLGSAIVRMLAARGDQVCILCRSGHSAAFSSTLAKHRSPLLVQADIRDATAVQKACEGQDVVFHVAAKAGFWGRRHEFQSTNVDGTRNVIKACRAAGVSRLVYTSSPSVVFGRDDLSGVNESQPYPLHYLADYPESKARAERMVLAANGASLSTVALRPHLIFGPGDPHLIPRVIDRARKGTLRQVGEGKNLVDITYIDNAAEAHLLAADAVSPDASCAGKPFFITQGEPVVLWTWLDELLQAVKAPRITRGVSLRTATLVGAVMEGVHRAFGLEREPRMTRFLANQLAKSHYFDISAAKRDLGYTVRVSLREGTNRLIEWLRRFPNA